MKSFRKTLLVVAALGALLCSSALVHAEVTAVDEHGFDSLISFETGVSAQQAYEAFLNPADWWNADHTWFGKASNLRIEPWAGGCFCEAEADKSVLHLTVSFVHPGREIRLLGGLGPLQAMGLSGVLVMTFEDLGPHEGLEKGSERTRVTHLYKVRGHVPGGFSEFSKIVDKVQGLQMQGLAAFLASG